MIGRLVADTRGRFLIAGGSAAALNWLIRMPLGLVMPYEAAVVVALAIGMIYGFIIYRNWAFHAVRTRSIFAEIRDFILVNLLGAGVTLVVAFGVNATLAHSGIPDTLTEAFAHGLGIALGAIVNYLGHKQFTFRA